MFFFFFFSNMVFLELFHINVKLVFLLMLFFWFVGCSFGCLY